MQRMWQFSLWKQGLQGGEKMQAHARRKIQNTGKWADEIRDQIVEMQHKNTTSCGDGGYPCGRGSVCWPAAAGALLPLLTAASGGEFCCKFASERKVQREVSGGKDG